MGVILAMGEGVIVGVGGMAVSMATCKVCVILGVAVGSGRLRKGCAISKIAPTENPKKAQATIQ